MTKPVITSAEIQEKMQNLKTSRDVVDFAKDLIAPTLQVMLEQEITEHLGYPKYDPAGHLTGNNRNGYSRKKLKTGFGPAELSVPRDRNGHFEPAVIGKHQTMTDDVEAKIISMYGKGMTTRDIHRHLHDIYGISVSADMVSGITDRVLPLVREWQNRPLNPLYAFVYLDGIHFKIRDGGKIVSKCAYVVLGINDQGRKEILGIWIGENEGAKFWLRTLNEIKQRGVEDILICCIDGLAGFSDAIRTVYPDTEIQQCIVHQVRNTTRYIPHKDKKKFCQNLRQIYTAPTEEAGLAALAAMQEKWPQYAVYLASWEKKWHELSPFFSYPAAIRKIMYTTNAIENLNRQFRKVTKTTVIFPHDESLLKLLYLAQRDISRQWSVTVPNWGSIVAQLTILFPEKMEKIISPSFL